jgi:hypothetical protein
MKSGSPAGNMSSRRSNGSCPPAQERLEVNKSSHRDELHMERCNKDPLTRKKRNNSQAYSIPIKRPTKTRSLTEKNEALTATRQALSFHGTKRTFCSLQVAPRAYPAMIISRQNLLLAGNLLAFATPSTVTATASQPPQHPGAAWMNCAPATSIKYKLIIKLIK